MSLPSMDRPSVAFAHLMDRAVVEERFVISTDAEPTTILACSDCGEAICDIDDGDTIRVLVNTALAHECGT